MEGTMLKHYLYDDNETPNARYVGFAGDFGRYDLAIIQTSKFFGKSLVLNMQNNTFSIVGTDDLDEPGYIAHALQFSDDQADEVIEFLKDIISPGWFMDY